MSVKLKTNLLFTMLLMCSFSFNFLFAEGELSEGTPERVILNLTETPSSSVAVTWRTVVETADAKVIVAKATGWKEFLDDTVTFPVKSTLFVTDDGATVFHHSGIMENLEPGTSYVYKAGSSAGWTEWNQFHTALQNFQPFSFVFMGDPQNEIREHCSRIFREAYRTAPDAAFWLFSGDLISEPEDWQYRDFFYAGTPFFRMTPSIMAPGNHDRAYEIKDGEIVRNERNKKVRLDIVAEEWKQHFTLPENGLQGFEEGSYFLDYQGVRFIMLDTNHEERLEEQAEWIKGLLGSNPNRWTVISFHHPFYSAGRDRDDDETRNAFLSIFDEYHVDLVLTGHDHAYSRSHKLVDGKKVGWNDPGTVYVVSVSGPKMYSVNSQYNHLMAKTGGNVQLFQVINVENNKLEYTCYTVTGEVYDRFVLTK